MERVWSSLLLLPTIHKNPHLKPPLYTFLYTHDVIAYNNVEKKNHCSFVEKQTWQIKEKLKTQMTQIIFFKNYSSSSEIPDSTLSSLGSSFKFLILIV